MKSTITFHLLLSAFLSIGSAHAQNIQIVGAQTELVGTTSDVPLSGTSDNYNASTAVGDFAVFDVNLNTDPFADLRVTYLADNGGVGSDLMIAQTSNSQGLADSRTLSILMNIGTTTGGTISLQFDWFTDGSFVGGVEQAGSSLITNQQIFYTSYDIDFSQVNRIAEEDVFSYQLDSSTELTAELSGGFLSFQDSGSNSTFGNPNTAYSVLTRTGTQSHIYEMGKQSTGGAALFMLEFSDPPLNLNTPLDGSPIIVPEPSAVVYLACLCLATVMGIRFRRKR